MELDAGMFVLQLDPGWCLRHGDTIEGRAGVCPGCDAAERSLRSDLGGLLCLVCSLR